MQNCYQAENHSVLDHGISVRDYFLDLYFHLKYDLPLKFQWKLPDWIYLYKEHLLKDLLPLDIILEAITFHDCGKFYVRCVDENGKQHFPDHAQKSSEIWLQYQGNLIAANLMKLDMQIHTISAQEVSEFIKNSEAISLILIGLAEITSNGYYLFGGINSTSFKIKYKQIDRRGKQICLLKYGENNE